MSDSSQAAQTKPGYHVAKQYNTCSERPICLRSRAMLLLFVTGNLINLIAMRT